MPALRTPMDFMDSRMGPQPMRTAHELRTQGRWAIKHHAGADHARRLPVIDAQLRDLDSAGMQVTIDLTPDSGEMFPRKHHGQTRGVAKVASGCRLQPCATQEKMKQTHDDSCPG